MIYTITFNPALDYIIKMQKFQAGEVNRSEKEYILPGGKGINVSIVLKELEQENVALGFIAGFVGEEIEKRVNEYGVKTEFIKIENENSRINVKIATTAQETAINGRGAAILNKHMEQLYKKIDALQDGDILILSGSIPKGLQEDIYENICEKVKNKNIKIVVDACGELLLKTLKYRPFLIKPNQEELEELFNIKISNKDEAITYAKKLQQQGAKNVLVSMGSQGAVIVDETGHSYKKEALNTDKRVNTVGAGDSMVAGFIAGYKLFNNYEKALQMGIAAATATTTSIFLATKNEIYKYFK